MNISVGGAMRPGLRKGTRIAVLGAGAAGLAMGYKLKAAGFENFTIFEKDDAVGGTWKRHNYPGLCCDVHSHIYSYSFDPNPYWSSTFPRRDELLAYFSGFADKHGLMPYVRLRTAVTKADYNEGEGTWTLTFDGRDDTETFDYLIAATGFYNDISIPEIPGRERFKGIAFHSSEWPEGIDLKGKRVGMVGTAAAAVQIAPAIHPDVAQLTIFQRTPSWIVPRDNHIYTAEQQRAFADSNDAWLQHRDELYDFNRWYLASVTGDREKLEELRSTCLSFLEQEVSDPELRAKLTPDYEPGCKRLLVTSDYYSTLIQPNVSLVAEAIAQVDETGIVTADGAHSDLDVLIWCTGYKMPNYHGPVLTTGVGGKTLQDAWPEIPEAFRSTAVPGFPNYFMVNGPNGIFGHSSAIDSAEISSDYIVRLIEAAEAAAVKAIDVKPEALREFNNEVAEYFKGTTFAGNCTGFYHDEKNRVWFFYPGDHDSMVRDLTSSTLEDFELQR